jgi:hypothetical protein
MLNNTDVLNFAPRRKFNEDDFLENSLRHISTVCLFSSTVGVELAGLATTPVRLFTARNAAREFGEIGASDASETPPIVSLLCRPKRFARVGQL